MASETISPSSLLTDNLPLLAGAPNGIQKLRELILELAVRGKLVPQDPSDEPASELLKRIAEEKVQLIAEGKLRKQKPLADIDEAEKPFELPSNWEWTRLGEITNFGTTVKAEIISDDAWVLDLEDIEKGTSKLLRKTFFSERNSLSDKNRFIKDDVLYGKLRPYLNKVIVADTEGFCTTEILPFRCHGPFNPNYFKVALKSPYFLLYVNSKSYGMKMPRLGTEDGRHALFPLPPLAEQHRIVAKVDELMALCDRLEAQQADAESAHARLVQALLDSLTQASDADDFAASWQRLAEHFHTLFTTESSIDALKQTLMQLAVMGKLVSQDPSDVMSDINAAPTLFRTKKKASLSNIDTLPFPIPSSWVWTSLGSLIVSGPTNGFSPKPSQIETGFRCLTLSSTTKGYFNGSCFKYVDITTDISKKYSIKKGDFLVQRANSIEYVGVSAIYDGEDDQYIYPDLMIRFRISEELNPSFIHLALSSVSVRSYFKNNATGTQGNMPKINQGTLVNALIPIPPLSEQHRIVTKFDQLMMLCDNLKDNLSQARRTLETLTNALVEQAVT
ncbi:restriction endonuclease subunit S [Pseudomonas luteola]|nr:restriction endonuclease subunit S [Pseudomonas luteola]